MTTAGNPIPRAPRKRTRRFRSFWARITEGLELQQLWGQFLSEAKASYDLYSRDVDWDEIAQTKRGARRFWRASWAVFQAILMKLSPARRVLLLIAMVVIVVQPEVGGGRHEAGFQLAWIGTVILFVLLALELADRVTMKRDLEIARDIQQRLVPQKAPDVAGFDIAFATRPQNTVAGDYYDAFLRPLSDSAGTRPLLIVVADVAGKSVPAALLMATFQASLRALAATSNPLSEIVSGLDRYTRANNMDGGRFTTAFIAQIDLQTRELEYTNAGHNNPILRRASGLVERLSAGGPPFGLPLFTDSDLVYESAKVQLGRGDLLFIFTDGLVEAINDKGEEFGESRLLPCIRFALDEPAAGTWQRVMTEMNSFTGYARQHDDITGMVLRINA
jgi:phosphoserine phosphatase RsbU/P